MLALLSTCHSMVLHGHPVDAQDLLLNSMKTLTFMDMIP